MKLEFKNFRKCTITDGLYLFDDVTYKGKPYGRGWVQVQTSEDDREINRVKFLLWKGQFPMPTDAEVANFMLIVEFHVNQAYIEYLENQI